ncbi:MAG: hypothetical protein NZ701_02120, partial [Roseiflexus sp.]|nr:hypothetical protein [Roseiflexus sp.]
MRPKRFPTRNMHWLALIILLLTALLSGLDQAQSKTTTAITVQDVPTTLTGSVTSFYVRDPKIFSHRAPPPCGPNAAGAPQNT